MSAIEGTRDNVIPALALVAYVLFVFVAFGWRTWLHYRSTGSIGFHGFSGGAAARAASVLLAAGLLLAPVAPVLQLAHWIDPLPILARPAVQVSGGAALLLGLMLTLIAQFQMGASWRIGVNPTERTTLVTRGVFRYVRNPIFTGIQLALVGLVLLVPNLCAGLAALCALAGLEIQVRSVEEPYLLSTHGEAYRDYARSVGRFIPGLGRLR